MSNAKFPTLQQVLSFFNFLLNSLNKYLSCTSSMEIPDLGRLELRKGIPQEIGRAALAARSKLLKYYNMTSLTPIYLIATGNISYDVSGAYKPF